jgi:hypothetical protein
MTVPIGAQTERRGRGTRDKRASAAGEDLLAGWTSPAVFFEEQQ